MALPTVTPRKKVPPTPTGAVTIGTLAGGGPGAATGGFLARRRRAQAAAANVEGTPIPKFTIKNDAGQSIMQGSFIGDPSYAGDFTIEYKIISTGYNIANQFGITTSTSIQNFNLEWAVQIDDTGPVFTVYSGGQPLTQFAPQDPTIVGKSIAFSRKNSDLSIEFDGVQMQLAQGFQATVRPGFFVLGGPHETCLIGFEGTPIGTANGNFKGGDLDVTLGTL